MKASIQAKQRKALISKHCLSRDVQNVSKAEYVHLKDRDGCICAHGIVDFTIKNGEDVGGLTLFPHQCAVGIEHVFEIGEVHKDET